MLKKLKTMEEVLHYLEAGETIIGIDDGSFEHRYRLENGVLLQYDKDKLETIGAAIIGNLSRYEFYIEFQVPFNLELGKMYKTRNGNKVVCTYINEGNNQYRYYITVLGKYADGYFVDAEGYYNTKAKKSGKDIIKHWED